MKSQLSPQGLHRTAVDDTERRLPPSLRGSHGLRDVQPGHRRVGNWAGNAVLNGMFQICVLSKKKHAKQRNKQTNKQINKQTN